MKPEVSVILITHNRPDGLQTAVESVFRQTFQNFELIVLDNGSSTESFKRLSFDHFNDNRFRYHYFDDNEKVGKRLNQGIYTAH